MIAYIIQTIIPHHGIKERFHLEIIIKPLPLVPEFHEPFLNNIGRQGIIFQIGGRKNAQGLIKFIKQIFMTDSLYSIGVNVITYKGFKIKIYDLERTLVEVARNKILLSYEDYHEIMNNYKKLFRLVNKEKLYNYVSCFKDSRIEKRIKRELDL